MCIVIGFVGFDGTGKTTQAQKLQHALSMQGIKANYVHVFSPKSTISSELTKHHTIDALLGTLDNLSESRSGTIMELSIRLPSLLLESWITIIRERCQDNVSIYDRYFYDKAIAILSSYSKTLNLRIKKKILLVTKLLPKPDITIAFRITPEVANKRKKEHTLKEAKEICALYDELTRILSIKTVNAENGINDVQLNIQSLCQKAFT